MWPAMAAGTVGGTKSLWMCEACRVVRGRNVWSALVCFWRRVAGGPGHQPDLSQKDGIGGGWRWKSVCSPSFVGTGPQSSLAVEGWEKGWGEEWQVGDVLFSSGAVRFITKHPARLTQHLQK